MGAFTNLATVGLNFALAQQAARQESGEINRERDRQVREIQARNEEERRRQLSAVSLSEPRRRRAGSQQQPTGERMAKRVMIDEIHLSFFVEADLSERQCQQVRRTLTGPRFKAELRQALRRMLQKRRSLQHVKCIINR